MLKESHQKFISPIDEFYYGREMYYADGAGQIKYKCGNPNIDAADTDTDWHIWKFVWVSGNMTNKQGPLFGAVNAEGVINALSWNI